MTTKGIDVSTLQGNINWQAVKADFAMIKASQGRGEGAATRNLRNFTDSKFAANIKAATAAGIPCGVYHYMTAQTVQEAVEEADYFGRVIAPYLDKITLWATADVESGMYLDKLSRAELTKITQVFLDRVAALGYKPMLYTNPNYLKYRFTAGAFDEVDTWLAHWGVNQPMSVPRLQIWQYGTGKVGGVSTDCDLNCGYFNLANAVAPVVAQQPAGAIKAGSRVMILPGARYTTGAAVPSRLIRSVQTVTSLGKDNAYIAALVSRIKLDGLQLV